MTALAADRNTEAKYQERTISIPVAAAEVIYDGAMVAVGTDGLAVAAAKTTGLVVIGRADEQADNSLGAASAIRVRVSTGVFGWVNDANAVAQADVGRVCYVVDDQTVADETEGSQVIAGIVDSIDPDTSEVFVRTMDADFAGDDVSAIETVTTGAISVLTRTSFLSCTGTIAYTLADGAYEGQRKTLLCTVSGASAAGTITPANYADGTSEHVSAVGERYELEWHKATGWHKISYRASYGAPETVTTGAISLFTRVSLISVTGTKAYTLADGLFVGQRKTLIVSAVASSPAGTLTPVTYVDGTTHLFQNVDERLELEWVGATGWKKISSVESLGAPETVTSGALSLYTRVSLLSVTGTQAYALADGIYVGQRKTVICSVAASTPAGTLTPATTPDEATHFFSAVGETLELEWVGATGWKVLSRYLYQGAAETVTTGAVSVLTETTYISCTGTVAYTLADGLWVGQKKYLRCTVAASTPDGTLTPANATGWTSADFDATEEAYGLRWDGAGWEVLYVIGGAIT
jgi:hypothetical protein